MGFNTVAVLLNDRSDDIKKSGSLGERIYMAMATFSFGCRLEHRHFGAGSVVSMAHADTVQVVVVHQNNGYNIGEPGRTLPPQALWMMQDALERHGFRVTKKRVRPDASQG